MKAKDKAIEHFTGEDKAKVDLREFNNLYSSEILTYLANLHTYPSILQYTFFNSKDEYSKIFLKQFNCLYKLQKSLGNTTSIFISSEPAIFNVNHFIMGICEGENLLIINPFGITKHEDFYKVIRSVVDDYGNNVKNIYLSDNIIQKDPGQSIVSCGAICAELSMHIASFGKPQAPGLLTQSIFDQVKEKCKIDNQYCLKENLAYKKIDIEAILPESLKLLLNTDEAFYEKQVVNIRDKHLRALKDSALSTEQNDEQVTVYKLFFSEILIDNIEQQEEYTRIRKRSYNQIDVEVRRKQIIGYKESSNETLEITKISKQININSINNEKVKKINTNLINKNEEIDDCLIIGLKHHYASQEYLPDFITDDKTFAKQKIEDSYVNLAIIKCEDLKIREEKFKYQQNQNYSNYKSVNQIDEVYPNIANEQEISIEDIFGEYHNKALIYGRAGIGKTTLLHKISFEWGKGRLWQDKFKYVFKLPLREMLGGWNTYNNQNGVRLKHFVHYCCFRKLGIDVEDVENILECKEDILILLDGYDEITNIHKDKESLCNDIIEEALNFPNVIMSSRPNAVIDKISEKFNRILENIGFNNNNLDEFVTKFNFLPIGLNNQEIKDGKQEESKLSEDITSHLSREELSNSLKQFLKTNNSIAGLCHIPINIYLLCHVWSKLSDKQNIDKLKATDLYYEIVNHLMKRYLSKYKSDYIKSKNINNVDSDFVEEGCDKEYQLLEKVAYFAMKRGEVIITPLLFKKLHIDPEELSELGLVKSIGSDDIEIINKDHYFIHLTFQEYFAARYIARLLSSSIEKIKVEFKNENYDETKIKEIYEYRIKEAVKFLEENKYSRMYEMVINFTSGLLVKNKENDQGLVLFWNIILDGNIDLTLTKQWSLIVRCLEEAKLNDRIPDKSKVLKYIRRFAVGIIIDDTSHHSFITKILKSNQLVLKESMIIEEIIKIINSNINGKIGIELLKRLLWLDNEDISLINIFIKLIHNSKDKNIRTQSLHMLGQLDVNDDIKIQINKELLSLFNDDEPAIRNYASNALIELNRKDNITIDGLVRSLCNMLSSSEIHIKEVSARTLTTFKLENNNLINMIAEKLIENLHDERLEVKKIMIESLGRLYTKDQNLLRFITENFIELFNNKSADLMFKREIIFAFQNLNSKISDDNLIILIAEYLIQEFYQITNINDYVGTFNSLKFNKETSEKLNDNLIQNLNSDDKSIKKISFAIALGKLKILDTHLTKDVISILLKFLDEQYISYKLNVRSYNIIEKEKLVCEAIVTICNLKMLNESIIEKAVDTLLSLYDNKKFQRIILQEILNLEINDEDLIKKIVDIFSLALNEKNNFIKQTAINGIMKLNSKNDNILNKISDLLLQTFNKEDKKGKVYIIEHISYNIKSNKNLASFMISIYNKAIKDEDIKIKIIAAKKSLELEIADEKLIKLIHAELVELLNNENLNIIGVSFPVDEIASIYRDITKYSSIDIRIIIKYLITSFIIISKHDPNNKEKIRNFSQILECFDFDDIMKCCINDFNNSWECAIVASNLLKCMIFYHNGTITLEFDGIISQTNRREKIHYPETWTEDQKTAFSNQIFQIFYELNKQYGFPNDILESLINCEKYFDMDGAKYTELTDNIILTKEQLEDSSISIIDSSVRISNCNTYAISIVRKAQSSDPYHTFLFVEGRNIFGNNLFYRFDLTYSRVDNTTKIEINNKYLNIKSTGRERIFQDNILKKRPAEENFILGQDYHAVTTIIGQKEFEELYAEIKREQDNLPKYNVRGIDAYIPFIFKHLPNHSLTNYYSASETGHNCFTWAREKIKKYTSEEVFKSLGLVDLALDRITAHPGYYLGRQ